jgi:hypothetical protein
MHGLYWYPLKNNEKKPAEIFRNLRDSFTRLELPEKNVNGLTDHIQRWALELSISLGDG